MFGFFFFQYCDSFKQQKNDVCISSICVCQTQTAHEVLNAAFYKKQMEQKNKNKQKITKICMELFIYRV